jgi:type VI secretion system protein ImpB
MSDDARDQDEPVAGRDRIHLEIRRCDGAEHEIPLRLLMLGDYTGRPDDTPVEERPVLKVEPDTFAVVMRAHALALDLEVPDVLEQPAPASTMRVSLRFRRLSDFEPEDVARQVPAVAALLDRRAFFSGLKGPLGGEKALRRKIEQLVDDPETRRRLAAECGVALDDATVTEAREECTAARDEARSSADPRRLAELASHRSLRVRRAVAANPAIDDATARCLARMSCDEHVAANPSVRARAQASPERFHLPAGSFLHLEWTEAVAAWMAGVDWGFSSRHLLQAYLLMEGPPEEASGSRARPRCAADCIDRWPCWSKVSREVQRAAYCQLSDHELSRLLDARRAAVPGESVEDALRHVAAHYPWHWRSIAERPQCPRDVLETLARAPQILVREAVARHETTPEEVRRVLLADPDITVREAAHARAGLPFLATVGAAWDGRDELLVQRAWEALRTELVPERDAAPPAPEGDAHPRAHQSWCQRLFERRSRARCAALPADVTEEQLWSFWSRSSKKRDTFYLYHDPADIVAHPRCPARVLAAVADDPCESLQLVAAIHPNATDELLDHFATRAPLRDRPPDFLDPWVRRGAIAQRAIPAHLRRAGRVADPPEMLAP